VFFVLSKILDLLLSPYTLGLLLLALAVPWRQPNPQTSRRKRIFGAVGLAMLLVFSLEPVSNRLAYWLEHRATSTYRPEVVYDAVILLGGMGDERVFQETGEPAFEDAVERVITTHRLLQDGKARFVIVTGGPEDPALAEWDEARAIAKQLALWGIDPSRVILEEKARNTRENAVYSERIVKDRGFANVLVVTSAFHLRRSAECFNAVGLKVDTLAADYRAFSDKSPAKSSWLPRTLHLNQSVKMIRELCGLYIYRLQGYAKPSL
jgi:uncharacterized SAM-binding protein YcdF (DUF218 family)